MNKAILAVVAGAFLLGNAAKEEEALIKRFLAAVAVGTGYQQEDFGDTPTDEEIGYLATLKGCKVLSAETVTGPKKTRGWAIEWSCRQKPRLPVAIVYIVDGKIDRILPSERIG